MGAFVRYIRLWRIFFALTLTSELGLTVVRSRSRENNTQLFSNTLASLRYALYGSNANPILRLGESQRGVRILSYRSQRNKKTTELFGLGCPFIWRRKRDSNPRAFWANGFQDRLVVTASIFLRVNSFTRIGYRCGSEIYFGIRFATFAKGEIFLRANEKVIKFNISDITLDVRVFAIFGVPK